MRKKLFILLGLINLAICNVFAQNSDAESAAVVEEGKLLYKLEMAAWNGTDLLIGNNDIKKENLGGYFAYVEDKEVRCIFLSKEKEPTVIGSITFDDTFDSDQVKVKIGERKLSSNEQDIYAIRSRALQEINSDTAFFKHYNNTSINLIPLVTKKTKKVYVMCSPKVEGVAIFGNDYLLTFDKNNKLVEKKALHKSLIPIRFDNKSATTEALHSHAASTGVLITPTDICTLMLYSKFAGWKRHYVVSRDFVNIWDCEQNTLSVVPFDEWEKQMKSSRD